jgi:N12 class adenine-specific DNA methylase
MSRIATGTYDAVIVSHSSFEKLPVSDETFGRFVNRQIEQLEEALLEARAEKGDNRRIVKELEKAKKRLTTKLKERADRENKDDAISFEQMGIDRVFVDESDLLQESRFRVEDDAHRRPPQYRKQPRARYVYEDALSGRAQGRHPVRHRHADLEHHGRDVHAATLSCARDAEGRGR